MQIHAVESMPCTESSTSAVPERITVVGAGQIGTPLVARLVRDGHAVVWVSRTRPASVPEGATHVSVDVRDGAALAEVARGSHAIIAAVNPRIYDAKVWERELPPLHRGLIEAASVSGVRLVVLDALYLYALEEGPLAPTTREEPSTVKGRIRKSLADMLMTAHHEGRIRATTLRASDFWGPDLSGSLVSKEAVDGLSAGKRPLLLGNPDVPHAFSHRDDVVDGLVRLALAEDDVLGQVFHAPVIHPTPRQLMNALAAGFGVTAKPRVAPRWLLRTMGVFSAAVGGLVEMLPQWEHPYLVDDSGYRARFGTSAVTLEAGVAAMTAR